MLESYGVMTEKANEYVAQFKATVVIQPSGTVIIAGGGALTDKIDSDFSVKDEDLKKLIDQPLWKREKKKKEKKAAEPEKK